MMDWTEIHKFVKESGGRALIVIDGRPALVVTSYQRHAEPGVDSQMLPMMSERVEEDTSLRRKELLIDDLPL